MKEGDKLVVPASGDIPRVLEVCWDRDNDEFILNEIGPVIAWYMEMEYRDSRRDFDLNIDPITQYGRYSVNKPSNAVDWALVYTDGRVRGGFEDTWNYPEEYRAWVENQHPKIKDTL